MVLVIIPTWHLSFLNCPFGQQTIPSMPFGVSLNLTCRWLPGAQARPLTLTLIVFSVTCAFPSFFGNHSPCSSSIKATLDLTVLVSPSSSVIRHTQASPPIFLVPLQTFLHPQLISCIFLGSGKVFPPIKQSLSAKVRVIQGNIFVGLQIRSGYSEASPDNN